MRASTCGTEKGYQRHRYLGHVTCRDCCDAHAVHVANWRARTHLDDTGPAELVTLPDEPAESLHPDERAGLVYRLHRSGLADVRIAELTAMTTYTTARIRSSLGLAPNENGGRTWPSDPSSGSRSSAETTSGAATAWPTTSP